MDKLMMEMLMPIGFDDLVDDVMGDWPTTIRVFLGFQDGVCWLSYRVLPPWTTPAESITSIAMPS